MCAVDEADPWQVQHTESRRARKAHRCAECCRTIHAGENYTLLAGRINDRWEQWKWCRHCDALADWMRTVCSGYLLGNLHEELVEHWYDGYKSLPFARFIGAMSHQWHDGVDPVPRGVVELANTMLSAAVA